MNGKIHFGVEAGRLSSVGSSRPGRPELVVVDRDYGAIGGVQSRWGRGAKGVPVHLCEHHLYANGKDALTESEHKASRGLRAASGRGTTDHDRRQGKA